MNIFQYDAVGNITENTETGLVTYAYDLASQMTLMMFHGARITQVYDTNGNLTGILRTSLAPVTMVYDKENLEIASRQGESVVSYTYSGDGLKRSEIVPDLSSDPPSLSITTLVWDGSEYLQGRD